MTTPAAHWAEIKALFDATVELPPAEREPLIAVAALAPEALAELRSLLAHHDSATSGAVFMAGNAAATLAEAPRQAATVGQRLGAWEVVRAIGAGGMGEVFEARRADGNYEGRAAVKLLKRGMDSAAVLQRFAQERQALARLSHPHIARLLDAGASVDGLPYFVLEYVQGQPIDEAVKPLSLNQRLHLFLQLADAVAHAHRNLLVHRDLKPGNVLVDSEGQVKLLDFGIAKALDPLEGSDGNTTVGGQRPYTPNYASPEQVRGEPVSTATDIYSLGVLLYQMLTGTRPTGRKATTPQEAARSVLEDEPTRPSRLSASEAVDPQWLNTRKKLEGDLDNILLKALEKAPERRYASVDALAADIQNVLTGLPVSARPATVAYVASKFVRRHRWAVLAGGLGSLGLATGLAAALLEGRAAAALGVLGLAGGLGVALFKGRQATLSRDEAQARLEDIRGITRNLVFRFGDAVSYLPGGMQIKEELLQDALANLDRLANGRDRDPALLADVANTYARLAELQFSDQSLSLDKPDAARTHATKAVALGVPLLPQRRDDWRLAHWLGRAHVVLAQLQRTAGNIDAGIAELQRSAAMLAQVDLSRADDMGRTMVLGAQASALVTQAQLQDQQALFTGRPNAQALAAFDEAEAVYRKLSAQREMLERLDATGRPEEPRAWAQVRCQLAAVTGTRSRIQLREDRLDESLAGSLASLALWNEAIAYDPATQLWKDGLAVEANHLAMVHLQRGQAPEALAAAELSRATAQALAQAEGPQSKWALQMPRLSGQRGRALAASGRHAEALLLFDEALAYFAPLLPAAPAGAAGDTTRRGHGLLQACRAASMNAQGRADEAVAGAQAAVDALAPLAAAMPPQRESLLAYAHALALLARLAPAQAAPLQAKASQNLQAAGALAPLQGLSAALRAEVGG